MAVEDVVNDSVVDSIVLLVSSVVFIGMNVLVVFVCCIVDEAVELLDCVVTDDWSVWEVVADDVIVFTGDCVDIYGWDEVLGNTNVTVDSSGMSFWSSLKYQMNVTPMTMATIESRIRTELRRDSRGLVGFGEVSCTLE